ncbi:RidA family protein [Streptomyces sp. NPDC004647]|uniref:RidA family protein n=1 Tax=Streptomyces sp. NPDC004647 TaxID=3154671 RepID=UPI0033B7DA4A
MTHSTRPTPPAPDPQRGRVVHGVVDGEGLYYAGLATAGPFVFMSGLPVDSNGTEPDETRVPPPYHLAPAAHTHRQTNFIYHRYVELLREVGSSLADVVQIEQYIRRKPHGDPYIQASRAKGFLDRGRPASALISTGPLWPKHATIAHTGIAVSPAYGARKEIVPARRGRLATLWKRLLSLLPLPVKQLLGRRLRLGRYHESLTRASYGEALAEEGPFNEVLTGGGYVFTVGDTAVDWEASDIHADAKVDDLVWWGSEIRSETEFVLSRLESYLNRVDASLDDVVHMTVYLTDPADLYELDLVWRRRFRTDPPARTVIPCAGLGIPAFEGTDLHHRDRAVRMEQMSQSLRPGHGYTKQVVSTGVRPLTHETEAIKAGPLLWTSGLLAGDASGLHDTRIQLDYLFTRLDAICQAGGTTLDNLVRLRAFVTDPADGHLVYEALRQFIPTDPPTVIVTGVPAPLHVPGARVVLDGVAYAPEP